MGEKFESFKREFRYIMNETNLDVGLIYVGLMFSVIGIPAIISGASNLVKNAGTYLVENNIMAESSVKEDRNNDGYEDHVLNYHDGSEEVLYAYLVDNTFIGSNSPSFKTEYVSNRVFSGIEEKSKKNNEEVIRNAKIVKEIIERRGR